LAALLGKKLSCRDDSRLAFGAAFGLSVLSGAHPENRRGYSAPHPHLIGDVIVCIRSAIQATPPTTARQNSWVPSATGVSQEQHPDERPATERDSGRESEIGPGFAFLKITDPGERIVPVSPAADLRVLLPEGDEFTVLQEKLAADGAQVRRVRYLLEEEEITGPSTWGVDDQLVAVSRLCRLNQLSRGTFTKVNGGPAAAARDAFDLMWGDHAPGSGLGTMSTPASAIVPAELTRFLPFQDLNPAQAAALPEIFAHDQNLFVVAPTGAGKTVIGMAAVLRAVVQQGRKAAWLVPQRSLTDELDSELAVWRSHGLRVERLSGEHAVDIERIHDADLWVATTENSRPSAGHQPSGIP